MAEQTKRIIMLATASETTNMVYHALSRHFDIASVIIEQRVPARQFWSRRLKRLGWWTVLGQILFGLLVIPYLNWRAKRRIKTLKTELNLDNTPINNEQIIHVPSVNSDEARRLLAELQPNIIVVKGTRIISTKTLECTSARFINMHAGITPMYRGVHGAYWALVESNPDACGVTIHLVDQGIDTGGILAQGIVQPEPEDNFVTYPLMQLAVGLPLLVKAIDNEMADSLIVTNDLIGTQSKLWSHPTIWSYLWNRWRLGVK